MKSYLARIFGLLLIFQICFEQNSFAKGGRYNQENFSQQNKETDSFIVLKQYNLINKTISFYNYFQVYNFEFPRLKFIEKWEGWIVVDSTLNSPETYSIIEDYQGESRYTLYYTDDYLKIENRQQVISEPKVIIEAKTFATKESHYIFGIRYSYSSPVSYWDEGYKFFEIIKDSIINDVTASVFEEPSLKDFFLNKKEFKKFNGYSCIKSSITFQKDSDDFIIAPVFTCENRCENQDKNYKQMCDVYKNLKKIAYRYMFKRDTGRFVLTE